MAVPGCMQRVVLVHRNSCSAMAGAGESTFSREPLSPSAIHVTHKKPSKKESEEKFIRRSRFQDY